MNWSPTRSFSSWLAIFVAVFFFAAQTLSAQPVNTRIAIISPPNAAPLYVDPPDNVSPFYNEDDGTITVSGAFADVPQALIDAGDVALSINGGDAVLDYNFTGSRTVDGAVYRSGVFYQRVQIGADLLWPMRKFIAEIVQVSTLEALARHQISIFDLRAEPDSNPQENLTTEIYGMITQLTDQGVGHRPNNDRRFNLEVPFLSILPQPSLANFNEELSNRAQDLSRYGADTGRECIKLSTLSEPNFQDKSEFLAYREALRIANAEFLSYKVAKALCNLAANPIAVAFCKASVEVTHCIKKKPEPKDFNLCVDAIEAEAQSLSIGGIADTGLNFLEPSGPNRGNRGLMNSHITVSQVRGKVNAYLRNLSVRWRAPLCLTGPNVEVEDSYITQTPWLNSWATCRNMNVNNGEASTRPGDNPGRYLIKASEADSERLEVSLGTPGIFNFSDPSSNTDKGACGLSFINDDANDAALFFREPFRRVLEDAWYSDAPQTMEAVALTKLFTPYYLGGRELPNHDIFAQIDIIDSAPDIGLGMYWLTNVTTFDQETLDNQNQRWYNNQPLGIVFSVDGRDPWGEQFDISQTFSLPYLNRILNVRAAAPRGLHRIYKPTWGELAPFGVRRPAGAAPDDKALLQGAALRQFDLAFLAVRNKRLQIKIEPIIDPFVYMPTDVTAETEVSNDIGVRSVYGIETLEVTFKERDREVNGEIQRGKTWLRLRGGFTDPDFHFSIVSRNNALFLQPHLISDTWNFKVVESNLPGCPMHFTGDLAPFLSCQSRMERQVTTLIKNAFRDTFIEFVSKIPAPQHWDADGETRRDLYFADANRRQERRYITFYGLFE